MSEGLNRERSRDLWLFMAGWAYAQPANCKKILDSISINAPPEDVANLLGAFSRNDAGFVSEWFAGYGVELKGRRASDAVLDAFRHEWNVTLAQRLSRQVEFGQHLSDPAEFRRKILEIDRILADNGVPVGEAPKKEGSVPSAEKPDERPT